MIRVLIVDDSRTSRRLLRCLLEAEGYVVAGEAKDGEEGIKKYEELKPDLITLDITMPVLDGVGALKAIRERDRDVKIVMITAAGQRNKIIECLKEGANEFVTKPYDAADVKMTIENVMKN